MVSKLFALILLSTPVCRNCGPGGQGLRRPGLGQETGRANLQPGSEWRPGWNFGHSDHPGSREDLVPETA